jgi:hypothetical protein
VTSLGDVTAVVLSTGESTAARALASVERQTPAAAEVIEVRGVTPFHRALNRGAARVRTAYFVQVDADMILDPSCCADLRACMANGVGVVIGQLRDPLLGRVAGIKLFRTACFAAERFPDSNSPDTDFGNAIARRGWTTIYAIKPAPGEPRHVFGDHAPDYSPAYTFGKYELLGARHRYRRAARSLRELFRGLQASPHDAARFAVVGAARGISLPAERDLLTPARGGAEFARLASFLAAARGAAEPPAEIRALAQMDARAAWRGGYRCGVELYRRGAPGAFLAALDLLAEDDGTPAWAALVGLCQGVFADAADPAEMERAFALVNQVLPYPHRLRLDER